MKDIPDLTGLYKERMMNVHVYKATQDVSIEAQPSTCVLLCSLRKMSIYPHTLHTLHLSFSLNETHVRAIS